MQYNFMTSSDLYDVTVIYDVTLLNEQFVNLGQGLSTKVMHRNTYLGVIFNAIQNGVIFYE